MSCGRLRAFSGIRRNPEGSRGLEDSDKMGKEWLTPISAEVRSVLEGILRVRPAIGSRPLFPSVSDPTRPVTYRVAATWLRKAEALAGLEPLRGASGTAIDRSGPRSGTPARRGCRGDGWVELCGYAQDLSTPRHRNAPEGSDRPPTNQGGILIRSNLHTYLHTSTRVRGGDVVMGTATRS